MPIPLRFDTPARYICSSNHKTMKPLVLALTLSLHAAAGAKRQPIPTRGVPSGQYGGDEVAFANEAFEQFILAQMDEWHVPGLSMAVIEGNKTWAKVVAAMYHSAPVRC